MVRLLALFGVVTSAYAFSVAPFGSPTRSSTARFMSEPSDTSIDDYDEFVTVESEPYEPTTEEALVSNVMDLIPDTTLGESSPETRAAINEAIYKLEAVNPTPKPTMSPLLNGVWEMRYAGGYSSDWALPSPTRQVALFLYSGGYSPGLFALSLAQKLPSSLVEVGSLEIAIQRDQPRVEAKVMIRAGMGSSESSAVSVSNRLEVESDIRLSETYESAEVMGQKINLPTLLQYQRDIYVTYLDEDVMIVRDASGVPEILIRKTPYFRAGGEVEDDMSYPGDGVEFGANL